MIGRKEKEHGGHIYTISTHTHTHTHTVEVQEEESSPLNQARLGWMGKGVGGWGGGAGAVQDLEAGY